MKPVYQTRLRFAIRLFFPVALIGLLGCGSKSGTISGKITFGRKPVPAGQVTFTPEKGKGGSAEIQEDGSYTVKGVSPGKAKITVMPITGESGQQLQREIGELEQQIAMRAKIPPPPGKVKVKTVEEMKQEIAEKKKQMAEMQKKSVQLPRSVQDAKTTPLSYEVKAGSQEHDIEIPNK